MPDIKERNRCLRKIRHVNECEAQCAMSWLTYETGDELLQVYACKYCQGWHVGHSISSSKAAGGLARINRLALDKIPPSFVEKLMRRKLLLERRLRPSRTHRLAVRSPA